MPLDAGEIVGDRYRVVKLLGQGGMGAVYRAWDMRLNRPVALKEMTPQTGIGAGMLADLREQFEREAQILATLTHPSLVRVTDYFSWRSNVYLVMDFIEGKSLADLISQEGAQSEAQVTLWAEQLLDALTYCHKRGVLHRDIKPQNIIITPEGRALLVDFGLVKLWDPQDPETKTVMRGAGTPEYAPPEQYDMSARHTDPRSDIYSLGATLYQALTGQAPPTATQRMASPASFVPLRHINAAVSPTIERTVLKALEIAMDDRFQSADEMDQALKPDSHTAVVTPDRAVWKDKPAMSVAEARPEPVKAQVWEQEQKPARKRSFLLGGVGLFVGGGICLVLAVGAVLVGLYLIGRESDGITPTAPSSATPVLPPTNTPVQAAESAIFEDSFDSSASGWEVGEYDTGDVGYTDGAYFVTSTDNGSAMWGVANRSFGDLAIEVDAVPISAGPDDNNAYGVVCREQGDGDGYYLNISGDGYYSIYKIVGGKVEALVDWEASSAIRRRNATNHIRAVCDGSTLTLFVNGQRLASAEDSTFTQGDIALTATTFEDEMTEIHFDDLVVGKP
jgi:serine/threonine protein kinase